MNIEIPLRRKTRRDVLEDMRRKHAGFSVRSALLQAWMWCRTNVWEVLCLGRAYLVWACTHLDISRRNLLRMAPALVLLLASANFLLLRKDPFALPFCDANGVCHEKPDKPSPRTSYSAWNKEQYNLWWNYYEELQERVDKYAEKRQKLYDNEKYHTKDGKRTRPLILLGDSITEAWSGTGLGVPKFRADGVPEVLESVLTSSSLRLDPIVLGASGDQTQHLLYRLEHDHMRAAQLKTTSPEGEIVVSYDPSAIFVVMIGTNNLGSGELPGPTAKGILAVVDYLLTETANAGSRVMLFNVLPRGDGPKVLKKLCPPRCSDDEKQIPYSSFMPAVDNTNVAVAKGIQELSKTYPGRIKQVDCEEGFLNENFGKEKTNKKGDNYEVKKELMPDLLHPNAKGHEKLANCIKNYIHAIDAGNF
uniref:SGNH hydrolase-type esterase domain-containing protein n=1 Tax=Pseudo-nitzschia delicatissima TaxID=44447 RepID=A0A7S0YCR7_9STRA|mmetsp:Transcript_632/g.1324  ORF Transcript_632/g.1324 Transcript_632/m.1324 type:complete len:419 (+) Transcript_632:89-1345(+)